VTNRSRLERVERILGAPACATCRDWPGDLTAFCLGPNDPWRRGDDERHCPDCLREPPITLPLSALIGSDATEVA
jgi:hypothetical protein